MRHWATGITARSLLAVTVVVMAAAMPGAVAAREAQKRVVDSTIELAGSQEVPAVATEAKAKLRITVIEDRSVLATLATQGIEATGVHFHEGAAGKVGDPFLTFVKRAPDLWITPTGAQLTEAQFKSLKAGRVYINVHSAKHPDGELRAQIKP